MSELRTLTLKIADRVAVLTLNRPDRLNAYTTEMGIELFGSLHQLDRDDDIRAIVITGAGRGFCAGADLDSGGETFGPDQTFEKAAELEAKVAPWNHGTPIICAINGPAVGVGATLPLLWDIRIASERARIGFVFTRRGIVPEAASTWVLPRLIGTSKAMELLLTGRIVDADEALALGLVSRVVPHVDLLRTAFDIGREIAARTAPVSVAITKRLVWRHLMEPDVRKAKAAEDGLLFWSGRQPDATEGIESFLEKRDPMWKMRASTDLPDSLADLPPFEPGG